jgi:hypothetical protein
MLYRQFIGKGTSMLEPRCIAMYGVCASRHVAQVIDDVRAGSAVRALAHVFA